MGAGVGVTHLTENLRLAQHQGIQPAGHAHHVFQGLVAVMLIKDRANPVQGHAPLPGQPAGHVQGVAVHQAVQLGTVAGGQQGRFTHAGKLAQPVQRPVRLVGGERQLLA